MRLKTVATTAISPDASQVLYTIEEADSQTNARRRSIWIIYVKGASLPRKLADDAEVGSVAPAWSPDGKQFAYFSAKSGSAQIWLINLKGGEARKLTNGSADVQSFAWSPDGKTIAYSFSPSAPQTMPKTNDGIRIVGQEKPVPLAELHLVNVESGDDKLAMKPELAPADFSFSPDGKEIAFSANADIFVLTVADGQIRKLVARDGLDANPQWSPDGKQIAFLSHYGQRGAKLLVSVIDADGKTPPQDNFKNFDFGFGNYPPRFFAWSADGKSLLISALSRMRQNLYALSVSNGESKQITTDEGKVFHDFSLSADKRTLAFLATDSLTPSEVFISSVAEFKPTQLTKNTNPQLSAIALSKPEVIRWTSKDGLEVEGLLMKPIGYEKGKKYPLLVQMEGTYGTYDLSFTGRVSADTPSTYFPFQQQIFAGQGYAVLMPNPRGSWGYGEEFRLKGRQDYGTGPYNDIISGVDAVIAQGVADPERLGIMGMAFDGYRAGFAITQTNRFKAATVGQPFGFDLVSLYGQVGPAAVERFFGGSPWQVPQNYAPISSINFAGNLKTPTFLFHLAEPDWVKSQSQELFTVLRQNKVPFEYVVYDQTQREFGTKKLNQWTDVVQRNVDWFNRWLR